MSHQSPALVGRKWLECRSWCLRRDAVIPTDQRQINISTQQHFFYNSLDNKSFSSFCYLVHFCHKIYRSYFYLQKVTLLILISFLTNLFERYHLATVKYAMIKKNFFFFSFLLWFYCISFYRSKLNLYRNWLLSNMQIKCFLSLL